MGDGKESKNKINGDSLCSENRINMKNQTSNRFSGLIDYAAISFSMVSERVCANEGTEGKGGQSTEPSRNKLHC